MSPLKTFLVLLLIVSSLTGQTSRGTVPRTDANSYAAHAEQDGLKLGASALSHKEVKKLFETDLNQCCVVVEVAVYPAKNGTINISLDDFTLREAGRGKDTGVNPSHADVLAARLHVYPKPPDREHQAGVGTESTVGYHRGTTIDPNTGRPTTNTGIYEGQTVSVGVPIGGGKQESPEAAAEESRSAIEAELKRKMLPETSSQEPVAGYLYFSGLKSKSGYELAYTVNDKKIVLTLK